MLSDDQFSLVSAAVDRELTPAQAGTFRTLLQTSPEAGRLFRDLSEQSDRLRKLPRRPAPPGVRAAVLARIDPPAVRRSPASRVGGWLPVAVAASALAAVTGWLATRPGPGPDVVEAAPRPQTPEVSPEPKPASPVVVPAPAPTPTPPPTVVAADPPKPTPQKSVAVPRSAPDLRGAPPFTPPPLAQVEARLPLLTAVADLDQPETQTRLVADLGRDGPVRLDLFARDPHRGAESLLAVAKLAGVALAVDPAARDRMKRKLPTTAYAVYTDSLTGNEVAKLAATLAEFDRRPDQGLFGQAHLVPMRDADRKDVRELLGADPDAPRRPRDKAADATKVKPGEKTGVMVVYLPPALRANPLASKDVRDYLAKRDDRKPGAVSLLVTVRGTAP
jgi:hypothetical protein